MFLLDTNVISELRRISLGRADLKVTRWASRVHPGDLYISVITVHELEVGVLRLERRDSSEGAALRLWLEDRVLTTFAGRILPFDEDAARAFAQVAAGRRGKGRPMAEFDAQIAAIARSRSAALATRNTADFEDCGVRLVNPWQPL